MKFKKGIFSIEIEITTKEIQELSNIRQTQHSFDLADSIIDFLVKYFRKK